MDTLPNRRIYDTQPDIVPPQHEIGEKPISHADVQQHLAAELRKIAGKKIEIFNKLLAHEKIVAQFSAAEKHLQPADRTKAIAEEDAHLGEIELLIAQLIDALDAEDDAYQNAGVLASETARAKIAQKIEFYQNRLTKVKDRIRHNDVMMRLLPKTEDLEEGLEESPASAITNVTEEQEGAIRQPKMKSVLTPTASGERLVHVARSQEPYQAAPGKEGEYPHETIKRELKEKETAAAAAVAMRAESATPQQYARITTKPAELGERQPTGAEVAANTARITTKQLQQELNAYGARITYNEDGSAAFAKKSEAVTALFSADGRKLRGLINKHNDAMAEWHKQHRVAEKQLAGEHAARVIERRANDTDTYARANLLPLDLNDTEGQKFYYDRRVEAARAALETFARADDKFPAVIEFTKDGTARFRNLSERILGRWSSAHPDIAALIAQYNKLRAEEINRAGEIVKDYGTTVRELSPVEKEAQEEAEASKSNEQQPKKQPYSFSAQRRASAARPKPSHIKFGP